MGIKRKRERDYSTLHIQQCGKGSGGKRARRRIDILGYFLEVNKVFLINKTKTSISSPERGREIERETQRERERVREREREGGRERHKAS